MFFVTNSKGKMKILKKTSGGYYSLWFMELKDLNLKIVYDFGCYLEDTEEQE